MPGWPRSAERTEPRAESAVEHDSSDPAHLADAVADELLAGRPVAIGFECPPFVPVPAAAEALGAGRVGEGNRSWSAGAGAASLATGFVQVAWVLATLRGLCPDERLYLDWPEFAADCSGLLVWEAFVSGAAKFSGKSKGDSHVHDATIAVQTFVDALPEPASLSTITAERPLSLAGAAALWSGWLGDPQVLAQTPLVIRA